MTTSLSPDIDRSQPPDKHVQDQEKSAMENLKVWREQLLRIGYFQGGGRHLYQLGEVRKGHCPPWNFYKPK